MAAVPVTAGCHIQNVTLLDEELEVYPALKFIQLHHIQVVAYSGHPLIAVRNILDVLVTIYFIWEADV
jgi:hypothetical protein